MNKEIVRIAIMGDSISQGLGSKLYNYCDELKNHFERKTGSLCEIRNFAYTGTTICYANKIVDQVNKFEPDIILSFYGNVDAMVRPKTTGKPNFYSMIPKRYKNNGMLDPRPFFSTNPMRSCFEHIDSLIRYNLKKILIKLQGTFCWVELDKFKNEYQCFLNAIKTNNCLVFVVSTVIVDEFYFPGTPENYKKYNVCLERLAKENDVFYIDVFSELSKYQWDEVYNNDHFHPNKNGYSVLAKLFAENIVKKLE